MKTAQDFEDSRHTPESESPEVHNRHNRHTELAELKATVRLRKLLPRGIRIGTWSDLRGKPYFVRYGSQRSVESFEVETTRNERAEELMKQQSKLGSASLAFNGQEYTEWMLFKKETGATMAQVWTAWKSFGAPRRATALTVEEAVNSYLALRLSGGMDAKSTTYRQMKLHLLDYLARHYGDRKLLDVTSADLVSLLALVKDRHGKKDAAAITKKGYLKDWNTFFNRACAKKWIDENPCAGVEEIEVEEREKTLLAIADAFRFLQVNLTEPVMPRVALEMWGFIRASTAARVEKSHFLLEDKAFRIPGPIMKSGKTFARSKHPAVLWDWLALATDETWAMTEKQYAVYKSQAFVRAGLAIKNRALHNVLRHSCISYFVAATNDFSGASFLADHSSLGITENYRNTAAERDGALWLKLTPKAVAGTFEQFLASP